MDAAAGALGNVVVGVWLTGGNRFAIPLERHIL
jgi:hypothetical protein